MSPFVNVHDPHEKMNPEKIILNYWLLHFSDLIFASKKKCWPQQILLDLVSLAIIVEMQT